MKKILLLIILTSVLVLGCENRKNGNTNGENANKNDVIKLEEENKQRVEKELLEMKIEQEKNLKDIKKIIDQILSESNKNKRVEYEKELGELIEKLMVPQYSEEMLIGLEQKLKDKDEKDNIALIVERVYKANDQFQKLEEYKKERGETKSKD